MKDESQLQIKINNMDDNFLIAFVVVCLITLIVFWLIIRSAARADTQVKNQEAMIWLLMKLCKQQGVPVEEIEEIKKHFKT